MWGGGSIIGQRDSRHADVLNVLFLSREGALYSCVRFRAGHTLPPPPETANIPATTYPLARLMAQ